MDTLLHFLNSFGLPQGPFAAAVFYGTAVLVVLSALGVVLAKDIFHSAIFLAVTLIGVAVVYLFLDAEFLAIAQVLIYVGAVVTLFIFAIMFTSDISKGLARTLGARVLLSAAACLALLALLVKALGGGPWQEAVPPGRGAVPGLASLGRSLLTTYVLPFELLSVLSLAALIGALVIAKAEEP